MQLVLFLFLLLSSSILCSRSSSLIGPTLITIKEKWQASLLNWLQGGDPCSDGWQGVTCDKYGHIIALNLTNKGLKGPAPTELSTLTSLTSLDLGFSRWSAGQMNQVSGDISAIGSLTNLVLLNLSRNVLNSGFPEEVLKLKSLIHLRLESSFLSGPFPVQISDLVNLQYLYLGNNSLTGDLPVELGSLVNLVELSLWNNPFRSRIPATLSNLANLTYLNLHNCSLWGGLPREFGKLTSLEKLHLYNNILTGTIPDTWQNMTNLYELKLEYNSLTKGFPAWLLHLPNLRTADLSHNEFYGSFPNITESTLHILKLECNFLGNPWPIAPQNMLSFTDYGNCFSNDTGVNDSSQYTCSRTFSCNGFFSSLSGGCPPCLIQQFQADAQLCICQATDQNGGGKSKPVRLIAGIVSGIFSSLLLFSACLIVVMTRWNHKKSLQHGGYFSFRGGTEHWEVPKGIRRFTFHELAKATSNFNTGNEIGMGGFGKVFMGILDDGKKVAIKRAHASSMQGSAEFQNEVTLLSRLHHRNLVHLEGFCEDSGLQVLVYEFVTNGNLHTWLFGSETECALDWYKRLDIALGVAQGLDYLHSFADPPVIHRDVKLGNILLDDHLGAKVSDFGLSKLSPGFEDHLSTMPAGTAGYIDPQYFLRRHLTPASDVYSYGVVLLELVTGQKIIDRQRLEEENLVEWVKPRLEDDGICGIIDPRLGDRYPRQIYEEVAHLALKCASFEKAERPTMQEVVSILEAHLRFLQKLANEEQQHTCDRQTPSSYEVPSRDGISLSCTVSLEEARKSIEGSIVLRR